MLPGAWEKLYAKTSYQNFMVHKRLTLMTGAKFCNDTRTLAVSQTKRTVFCLFVLESERHKITDRIFCLIDAKFIGPKLPLKP
ncbi:hypothetical protein C5D35_10955 [Rathayibacter toxicus]|nr:hypothetical protein C5D35_10955 [Rathayibacter toxicus]